MTGCCIRTFQDHITESSSVARVFGDRLAKVVALARPVINNELQMVDGDGAADSVSQRLDHIDSSFRGSMLQDDLQVREGQVNLLEMAQELFLSIHHAHILYWRGAKQKASH